MPTGRKTTKRATANGNKNNKKSGAEKAWDEPKTKWGKSKARKLLYLDILEGRVPRTAFDENGKRTAKLIDIYNSRDEFKKYHYSKFSSRLGIVRKTIDEWLARKELDQAAFDNYVSNHPISRFSHKGYIQWQGSDAQKLALEHMKQNTHNIIKWDEWYGEHEEFYLNFPPRAFKEKVRQEIRTAKYLYTLEVRGKDARKTKTTTNEITNDPIKD